MAREGSTVRVSGLPLDVCETRLSDKLFIHFLRRRNGGGEIASVTISKTTPGSALITYEESEVAQRVAQQERHVLAVNDKKYDIAVSLYRKDVDPDEVFLNVAMTVDYSKLPKGKKSLSSLRMTFPDVHFTFDPRDDLCTLSGRYSEVQVMTRHLLGSLDTQQTNGGERSSRQNRESVSTARGKRDDSTQGRSEADGETEHLAQSGGLDLRPAVESVAERKLRADQPPSYIADQPPSDHADHPPFHHADQAASYHTDQAPSYHTDQAPSYHTDQPPSYHADQASHDRGTGEDGRDRQLVEEASLEDYSLVIDSDIFRYLRKHCAKEYRGILRRHGVDILDVTTQDITILYPQPKTGHPGRSGACSLRDAHHDLALLYQDMETQLRKERVPKDGLPAGGLAQAFEGLRERLPGLMVEEDNGNVYLVGSGSDVSEAKQFLMDMKATEFSVGKSGDRYAATKPVFSFLESPSSAFDPDKRRSGDTVSSSSEGFETRWLSDTQLIHDSDKLFKQLDSQSTDMVVTSKDYKMAAKGVSNTHMDHEQGAFLGDVKNPDPFVKQELPRQMMDEDKAIVFLVGSGCKVQQTKPFLMDTKATKSELSLGKSRDKNTEPFFLSSEPPSMSSMLDLEKRQVGDTSSTTETKWPPDTQSHDSDKPFKPTKAHRTSRAEVGKEYKMAAKFGGCLSKTCIDLEQAAILRERAAILGDLKHPDEQHTVSLPYIKQTLRLSTQSRSLAAAVGIAGLNLKDIQVPNQTGEDVIFKSPPWALSSAALESRPVPTPSYTSASTPTAQRSLLDHMVLFGDGGARRDPVRPAASTLRRSSSFSGGVRARREDQGTRREEQGTRREEQGTRREEQGTRREEQGIRREEQGTRREEQGTRREEQGTKREEQGTRREEQGTRREEQGTRQEEQGTRREEQGTRREEQGTKREEQGTRVATAELSATPDAAKPNELNLSPDTREVYSLQVSVAPATLWHYIQHVYRNRVDDLTSDLQVKEQRSENGDRVTLRLRGADAEKVGACRQGLRSLVAVVTADFVTRRVALPAQGLSDQGLSEFCTRMSQAVEKVVILPTAEGVLVMGPREQSDSVEVALTEFFHTGPEEGRGGGADKLAQGERGRSPADRADPGRRVTEPLGQEGSEGGAPSQEKGHPALACACGVRGAAVSRTACGQTLCPQCQELVHAHCQLCPPKSDQGSRGIRGTIMLREMTLSVPGYPKDTTVKVTYDIPDGIQGEEHPCPGAPFKGGRFEAFLPDNEMTRRLFLPSLKRALEQGLTFSVKAGVPGAQGGVPGETEARVIWGCIPHKTNIDGGKSRNGYPDSSYFKCLAAALKSAGVEE